MLAANIGGKMVKSKVLFCAVRAVERKETEQREEPREVYREGIGGAAGVDDVGDEAAGGGPTDTKLEAWQGRDLLGLRSLQQDDESIIIYAKLI